LPHFAYDGFRCDNGFESLGAGGGYDPPCGLGRDSVSPKSSPLVFSCDPLYMEYGPESGRTGITRGYCGGSLGDVDYGWDRIIITR